VENQSFPDRDKGKEVFFQGSRQMDSLSRRYYEHQLGAGMGPEFSLEKLYGYTEPVRRLIQREESTPQANEIPNTMPSWLPGDDYLINFRKGDPFAKIDQGYARLPGAGYAAIHPELKDTKPENYPDIYKLSILADVAPYSREYNIVRQAVAKEAQNNTQLRIEYEKILERVKETKESSIKMDNRHFTEPTEEIQGTVASVSPAGITLREFPGRVFQYSSVGLSAADMSARVLGENNTRFLRPSPPQEPRAPARQAGFCCRFSLAASIIPCAALGKAAMGLLPAGKLLLSGWSTVTHRRRRILPARMSSIPSRQLAGHGPPAFSASGRPVTTCR